jgi:hypothetical protein
MIQQQSVIRDTTPTRNKGLPATQHDTLNSNQSQGIQLQHEIKGYPRHNMIQQQSVTRDTTPTRNKGLPATQHDTTAVSHKGYNSNTKWRVIRDTTWYNSSQSQGIQRQHEIKGYPRHNMIQQQSVTKDTTPTRNKGLPATQHDTTAVSHKDILLHQFYCMLGHF